MVRLWRKGEFLLSESLRSRGMPITLSRLLHLGLVIALEHWVPAYQPDVAFAADGSFLVAWHEEQFPLLKTVVQSVSIPKAR